MDGLEALADVDKREDVLSNYRTILAQYTQRIQELHALLAARVPMGTPVAEADADDARDKANEPSAPSAAAAVLSQGRLCAELAIQADEAGEARDETIKLYTTAAEMYMQALRLDAEDGAGFSDQRRHGRRRGGRADVAV